MEACEECVRSMNSTSQRFSVFLNLKSEKKNWVATSGFIDWNSVERTQYAESAGWTHFHVLQSLRGISNPSSWSRSVSLFAKNHEDNDVKINQLVFIPPHCSSVRLTKPHADWTWQLSLVSSVTRASPILPPISDQCASPVAAVANEQRRQKPRIQWGLVKMGKSACSFIPHCLCHSLAGYFEKCLCPAPPQTLYFAFMWN